MRKSGSKTLVDKRHNHINGIEGFWSYAKHKLYNYRGVSKSNFPLYLKEMEYRYNHRKEKYPRADYETLFWLRFVLITLIFIPDVDPKRKTCGRTWIRTRDLLNVNEAR